MDTPYQERLGIYRGKEAGSRISTFWFCAKLYIELSMYAIHDNILYTSNFILHLTLILNLLAGSCIPRCVLLETDQLVGSQALKNSIQVVL